MKILLVGDYPNDPRLGSAKVPYKLREEFQKLGHSCQTLFENDLGTATLPGRIRWLVAPLLAARSIRRTLGMEGAFDVLDIASAEGFIVGLRKRLGGFKRSALISRSNGLEHLNYARMLEDAKLGITSKPWYRQIWYPVTRMSQVAGAARLCDTLLLVNETDRAFALHKRWKVQADIVVVPHGVSSRFLDDRPKPDALRGKGILFCGSWDDVKGVPYLVKAFDLLVTQGSRIPLTILGGGPPEDVIKSAFAPSAREFVHVVPRVSEAEVIRNYREHDVLLFCSTYEGFGMVLIEAMSQGLAVIATPVGAGASLVRHEQNGLSIPIRNAEAIAQAIKRLMSDQQLRQRCSAAALETVSGMSWHNTALRTLEVYRHPLPGLT